jgi:LysM repeat protein
MRNRFLLFLQLGLIPLVLSCKTYKPVVSKSGSSTLSADSYIAAYKEIAVSEMKRTGIPASITLAQGMIESDFGRSSLAREANNHFGIKCHNDWKGPTVKYHDDKRNECFRKYRTAEDSYYDHSEFLRTGSRYSSLFTIDHTDYKGWARGLKKAGYATNPDYANMLIRKIEENNLMYLDQGVKSVSIPTENTLPVQKNGYSSDSAKNKVVSPVAAGNVAVSVRVPRVKENNRIQYIVVKDGDTRENLEEEFQLLKWELPRYNELQSDFKPVPGQILYLQPKRDKAEPGKEFHNTIKGDTMYQISQLYGIKLKILYEMNRMNEGTEPEEGVKIQLRGIK